MTGFLGGFGGQLGKSLADKWLGLLALPGALYLAVVAVAGALGQSHALDVPQLVRQVTAWAHAPAAGTVGGQVVLLLALLAGSVMTGLVARVLGAGIERVVLAAGWHSWPRWIRPLAQWRTLARRRRWDNAHAGYSAAWTEAAQAKALGRKVDAEPRHAALRARSAIAAERPDRPTWSGDRIHGVSERLRRDHRLDLALLWPHLWLVLPEQERTEITAARTSITRATELGAWALLYAPLVILWWPAGVVAVVLAIGARGRVRATTDTYAQLVEAAVRLHTRDLAERLGIEYAGPLTPDAGETFDEVLGSAPPVG
ncbi:hypothetical protein FPZ12_022200 [Amycolatopsis acidicola]|uniref:Vegetative cell wall protein gp1 n=1 Tax=Amycolatopsis acidicola TaxID=2596893 RepID=A0A5N0V3Y3_9PSEU|nr:hypothetical protein [Amycolatopsis acidicola]KAA9158556.1 hypothetical protein FPZ12_022200 [Amycolatopsis acidicola]